MNNAKICIQFTTLKSTTYIVLTIIDLHGAWILDVMLIALVSKVTLLAWLSKFVKCWVPRESVLRGSGAHKATSTAQNLKFTLIEWHLKLTLLALHQVFTPWPLTLYQNKFLLCNCNIWKKFGLVCLLAVMMMVSYFFLKGTCGPMAWSKNVLLLDQIFDQDWLLVLLEKVIMRLWKHQVHIW